MHLLASRMYAGLGIHNPRHPTNRDTPNANPERRLLVHPRRVINSGGEGVAVNARFEILLRCGYRRIRIVCRSNKLNLWLIGEIKLAARFGIT